MTKDNSATGPDDEPLPRVGRAPQPGVLWGLLGVLAFSVSLPATRAAVHDLDPVFAGIGRSAVAAVLAATALGWAARRQRLHRPDGGQLRRLVLVAAGVVFGFPLLTAWALQRVPSAHGAVVVGLLPTATAVLGIVRGRERPGRSFVLASAAGVAAVVAFGAAQGGGRPQAPDLLLLLAVLAAGVGYVEGALLARLMPPWQVICWALVVAAPVSLPLTAAHAGDLHASAAAWAGFAYTATVSSLLGFFAWYRGLALGGIARIGQLQLLQPVFSLGWAALLLGERIGPTTVAAAVAIVGCALAVQRTRPAGAVSRPGRSRRRSAAPVAPART